MLKGKSSKVLLAGVLSLAMAGQPVLSALPVHAEEPAPEKKAVSEVDISKNDNVLYTANVGTSDPSITPTDAKLGVLQSNVDQKYGTDTETGYAWGYQPDDENSARKSGGSDTSSLKGTYIYMSDDSSVIYDAEKSGFYYDFEIPERTDKEYTVTVGVTVPNWWGNKVVDVIMEGKTVGDAVSCPQNTTTEKTYTVTVEDGELNICVKADPDTRKGTGDDPMLSYIIVKAANVTVDEDEVLASYKADLQGKVDEYEKALPEGSEDTYTTATWLVYAGALADAKSVLENSSATADELKAALEALTKAYAGLIERVRVTYDSITGRNGDTLYDTNGEVIQAHGGQVQKWGDTYYWYGEDKSNDYRPVVGVHLYTSTDLYNWEDQGVVLKSMPVAEEDYEADIADTPSTDVSASIEAMMEDEYYSSLYSDYENQSSDYPDLYANKLEETFWNLAEDRCVIERPKVLYNASTKQYVMWFHADGRTPKSTADYGKALAGVAVSDSPTGPFKLLGTYLLAYDEDAHNYNGNWDAEGGHVRDMTLFQDTDGTAYVAYSSEGNAVMYLAKLNDSYTGLVKDADDMVLGEDFQIMSTNSREAPALFKYNDKYYAITSGTNGWNPTASIYSVADSPLGEWTQKGTPFVQSSDKTYNSYDGASMSFGSQVTNVITVDAENGKYIFMGDRWYATSAQNAYYYIGNLRQSTYIWLPIEFGSDDTVIIRDYSDWKLSALEGKGAITINTELPKVAESVTALLAELPGTLDVSIGNTNYPQAAVSWSYDGDADYALGDVTISGIVTLAEGVTRDISFTVFCCPSSLAYFADCYTGGNTGNTSEIFEKFALYADDLLNTVSDQAYGSDNGVNWGYTSTPGASGASSSEDMGYKGTGDFFDTGWWATSSGTIEYSFELEPGNYVVSTGYQEWWSGTRGIKITANSVDASGNKTEIGTTSFTLSGEQDLQKHTAITVPEDSDHVLVTISKNSGGDPLLSWIGIASTDEKQPVSDNLVVNGGFENGKEGWNASDATVIEDENAPEGTHYLRDNGDKNSWGAGSSQSVAVAPDTEYVLTGKAKVDSGVYWVGANVDGKEIYSVFSSAADYTDTTNTDKKVAYQVCAGATEWTDFEIRFTTGSDTTSMNVYTWADPKVLGYLDNVVLTEVVSTVDWTAFDEKIAEIEALDSAEYTSESWAVFQEVVKEAKDFKVNATDATKQREIRLMIAKLNAAMEDLISIHEPTGNVTYYVDAVNGDDSNDGTTPETAWKTLTKASSIRKLTEGGSILLKAGCVWNGEQLEVKNAEGTVENPIVIGSYGEGAKPVINGNGANWSADSKEELAAVHIYNSENIIIENLEITNWDSSVSGDYTQSSKLLSGLVVENKDAGELANVVIRNNKIHDVNGKMAGGSEKAAGGLIAVVTGGGSNHTGTVESYFAGLTIEGNEVYKVCHEAIYMESVWASRKLVGGSSSDTGYQNAGNSSWIGSSDVVIENNYVHDVAGDGIVPINTTDCLVQYNLIDNSADTNWNYSNNPNHAALWTWDTDNVTFRYNEACNTSKEGWNLGISGTNDSMAFDFDYGVQNCLYEYNYSHDNYGGFLMLCPGPGATVNNIARYNLSVNDGLYDGAPMIRVGGGKYGSNGVQIYNNTMYWAETGYSVALAPTSNWEGSVVTEVSIFNNIFYGPAKADSVKTDGVTYSNNLVWGGAEDVYTAAVTDETTIAADPKFVDETDYTTGSWADGKTTLGKAEGFKLQADSPAINAGADHPEAPSSKPSAVANELVENKTEKPAYDYYGTPLTDEKNDIGANEYVEKVVVNKEALAEAIKDAEAVDAEKYTEVSYADMAEALENAQEVYKNEDATQAEVDGAAEALNTAIDALVEKPVVVPADKTELEEAIKDAEAVDGTLYTENTYAQLQEALEAAKAVNADEDAVQEDVDAQTAALKAAIAGLVKNPAPVDPDEVSKDALQKLYDSYQGIEKDKYTQASYDAYVKAMEDAEAVLADENAAQDQVDAAYKALTDAINGLTVEIPETPTNPTKPGQNNKPGQSIKDNGKDKGTSTTVKTGDTAPIALYVVVAVLALAAVSGTLVVRRRRRG